MNRKRSRFDRLMLPTLAASAVVLGLTAQSDAVLFFSEYIEGSSNNKALEIYNSGPAAVDLAATSASIQMFFNGSASAGLTINLTGTIAPGDVFVLAQSSANAAILAQADQLNGGGFYNGDDAITLRQGTTVVDSIGQIGFDPGTAWVGGAVSTLDRTLRRKTTVTTGDTNTGDVFDPSIEWDVFPTDTVDDLGTYGAPPPPPPASGAVLPSAGQTLTIDFTGFTAAGFAPVPTAGQLDSDNWRVTGLTDGNMNFGDTRTTANTDFTRGPSTGGVNTGGVYAFDHGGVDVGLGIQPTGDDFTPGAFELRLQNTTGGVIDALSIAYDAWVFNDQTRANSLNFAFSVNGVDFTAVPGADLTSIEAADTAGWTKFPKSLSLTGLALPNNGFLFLRWTGNDVSGANNRDEFALDNIRITNGIIVPEPASLTMVGLAALALLRRRHQA